MKDLLQLDNSASVINIDYIPIVGGIDRAIHKMKPRIKIVNNGFTTIGRLISGYLPNTHLGKIYDCGMAFMIKYPNCIAIHISRL